MKGKKYTWARRKGKSDGVEEKYDRALVTIVWFDQFPNFCLSNIIASNSDHYPILLKLDGFTNK